MGLLLSVLVVCVGVLEVLACVRHFQDGYLPLWTPHCAVTSGYTASYERWRKKTSDSCEFRSFDDSNGGLCPTENELAENRLAISSNAPDDFTGKQVEKGGENVCYSTDLCYQQSKVCCGNGLSPSIDDGRVEAVSCLNVTDILAPSLVPDEGEIKFINGNIENVIMCDVTPDSPEYNGKTKEAEFSFDLPSDNIPVNVSKQNRVLIAHTKTDHDVILSQHELQRTFSHNNEIEECFVSGKEIDIENEVLVLNDNAESYTSPCTVITEGNFEGCSFDSGKSTTVKDNTSGLEEHFEISSSNVCEDDILYTSVRETILSAVENRDGHGPFTETESNISMCDSITEVNSSNISEPVEVPSIKPEAQVLSPDCVIDTFIRGIDEIEDQIHPQISDVLIPSHVDTQDNRLVLGFVERDTSNAACEVLDKPDGRDASSREEFLDSPCLNNGHGSQNLFVINVLSEEVFIAPVQVSSQDNVRLPVVGLESVHTDASQIHDVSSPESFGDRKELSDWISQTESERCLSAECDEQHLEASVRKELETLNVNLDNSCSHYDTESGADVLCPVVSKDVTNVTFEEFPSTETRVGAEEDVTGTKHAVSDRSLAREPSSPDIQSEKEIANTKEDAEDGISESCLDPQTILTDSVISRHEITSRDFDLSVSGDLGQDSVHGGFDLQASSDISVAPLAVNTAVQLPVSVPPLSINTSLEKTSSVTPLPSDHQPSVSPPKVPSTPKRSKADISWPTFFPGTPVIKRPSVSFATPESVCPNDDFLRQYVEDYVDRPCFNIPDDDRTPSELEVTTSTSEGSVSDSVETLERSDSLEEPDPIIYREKSPSSLVSGNDFSRKELKLQRRKSYKQKRYNSAIEIRTTDEETEDRSFSENNPGLIRASSLREPKKRYKKPAKSSSFEDVFLQGIKTDVVDEAFVTNTSEEICAVSIPEGRETERHDQENFEETKTTSDVTECLRISTERNESKFDESTLQEEEKKEIEGNVTAEQKEDDKGDDDEHSLSEELSSSQQKSPPKEAFWLIFSGEYTKAMSKDWHSGHFCCWQCDESLTGQRYVLRDDHPYCIKCYESVFANVCEECNKTIGIDSKDLSYKDKHWHEACFLCNKCRVSLVDKQFGSKADKIYCGNCYDAQFASRCDGCGEIFRAGTKKMEYKTRQWHEKCFCCCVCKTAIGTKSFIPREQEIYCATCYEEKFATRCVKCNKIITSGGVTYKNEPWHRECFTCTHCNTSLAGQRFTSRDEKPYCAECFGELFAKRCTSCSKPITGIGGTRFISFEDRHWHNDCFICATCKTSLVGRGFITDADDIICPECAKQKLM